MISLLHLLSIFTVSLLLQAFSIAAEQLTPDTKQCCRRRGVSNFCVDIMCDFNQPPNEFQVFSVAEKCPQFLPVISQCLADSRDHTPCCTSQATDADQNACFDICSGSAQPLNDSHWDDYRNYMACLSLNIGSVFQCFKDGYVYSPTPPAEICSEAVSPTSAYLSWKAPERYPEMAKKYFVYYGPMSDSKTGEMAKNITTHTTMNLNGLNPDTKYAAFVVSASEDGQYRSAKSEKTIFLTKGVAPDVTAYNGSVQAPMGGAKTLVCRVNVRGLEHRHLHVVWQKETEHRVFVTLQEDKYDMVAYVTAHRPDVGQPRTYVSAFSIENIQLQDFGVYRCVARNQFGSGSADVSLGQLTDLQVPATPPNVTACCKAAGVMESCLEGCKSTRGEVINATRFMPLPGDRSCALDVPKILGCSMEGMDQGACCLRRKVPFHCLPFCDGTVRFPLSITMYSCLVHTTDILTCHLEAKAILPEVPEQLRIVSQDDSAASISWQNAKRATAYHVYFRIRSSSSWDRKTVSESQVQLQHLRINSIYEIVVISANVAGNSGSSRILHLLTGNLRTDRTLLDFLKEKTGLRKLNMPTGKLQEDLVPH